jgi:anti-anti-sigma factor
MKRHEQLDVTELVGGRLIVLHDQFIGGEETDAFRTELLQAARDKSPLVLVDMNDVPFVNSAFIGALLAGNAEVMRNGGALVVARLTAQVDSVFRLTKLHKVLPIYTRLDVALGQHGVSYATTNQDN